MYRRVTCQLLEYWPAVMKNPTGNEAIDEFAVTMDNILKIVFSHTLKNVKWKSARLAKRAIIEEVSDINQQDDKNILVGSRGLFVSSMHLNLIDKY